MFQDTPLERSKKSKPIIDSKRIIKIKDIIYPTLLKLAGTKVKYKIVRDNDLVKLDNHPVIIAANHTRFQDTPIVCKTLHETLGERGYIFAGKQRLGLLDNIYFNLYGSIFIDRKSKADAAVAQQAMEEYLALGKTVIVFPEATWNLSDELLMLPMKWGIIKSANRQNAQIIPTILDYDDEKKECHVSFGEPRLIDSSQNLKEEIDALRDSMAAMRFGYISKKNVARENLSVEAEREKKEEMIAEYPNYDYDYEQSCIYQPNVSKDEAFAHVKKLVPNKQNAFLFNKRNSGI